MYTIHLFWDFGVRTVRIVSILSRQQFQRNKTAVKKDSQ